MTPANDPIQHIVVLMLENRSFDHMLGSMRSKYPGLDGIDPAKPGENKDAAGNRYAQQPRASNKLPRKVDPMHEHEDVMEQIDHPPPNGGFVRNFLKHYPSRAAVVPEVMDYFDRGGANRLPVLHTLAEQYLLLDQWYSSVPGPTWPNRFFVHSGTSNGLVSMGSPLTYWNRYDQNTIYDELQAANIPWRIYHGDIAQAFMLKKLRRWPMMDGFHEMDWFYADAAGRAADFPAYSFIEPRYFVNRNDQHPPANVLRGDRLVGRVYNALRANPPLWESTLLIVTYDEHGGFYDHRHPPGATPPGDPPKEHFKFDRYGVRVPALLISPHVARDFDSTLFDHTSILKYAAEKWSLPILTDRVRDAHSLAPLIMPAAQPPGVLAALELPDEDPPPTAAEEREDLDFDDLQLALLQITEAMEREIDQPTVIKAARALRSEEGPRERFEVAMERMRQFVLEQRRVTVPTE